MNGHVLVVDHDINALKGLDDVLRAAGYVVHSYDQAALALTSMIDKPPELILIDLQLPDMTGFELCQQLKQKEQLRGIPVIFIGEKFLPGDILEVFALGAVDYIKKPYQKEVLLTRVKTHIMFNYTLKRLVEAEVSLQKMALKYKALMVAVPDGLLIIDTSGHILIANTMAELIFGYTSEELIGQSIERLMPERYQSEHQNHRQKYKAKAIPREMGRGLELYAKHKDGHEFPVDISLNPIETEEGLLVTAVIRDISSHKQTEMKLEELSHFDLITGLPNRAYFYETLKQSILNSSQVKREFALLYLDVDDFKKINDTYGHGLGDKFLRCLAKELEELIKGTYFLARIGGDEFVVMVDDVFEPLRRATQLAERMIEATQFPYYIDNHELHSSFSIGIALYPGSGSSINSLMKNADLAMYRAKELGKNTYQFFSDELSKAYKRQMVIESHLRHAIEKNEFFLVYQPQISLQTGKIYGVEALLRWSVPELGSIAPGEFIPIAEDMGIISEIGEWVLEQAFSQFQAWEAQYVSLKQTPWMLSINFSAQQLMHGDLALTLATLMNRMHFNPAQLVVEVTETALMSHFESSVRVLEALRRLGVRVAIDDFGTGYSSLNYLKRLPFSILKIAHPFVKDIIEKPNDASIATAIIQLGLGLGVDLIVEGIETAQQFDFFQQAGCHYGQGYYLSYPLLPEECVKFFEMNGSH